MNKTILVKHRLSGETFLLLGTGFNALSSLRPAQMLGNFLPQNPEVDPSEGDRPLLVAVCDYEGRLHGFDATEIEIVSIDGQKPMDLLPEPPPQPEPPSVSPQVVYEASNNASTSTYRTTGRAEGIAIGNQIDEFDDDDDWI